ncbi:hypothetical protein EMCRGX_G025868 [Ephydatia muelleri]|eukprot:Em0021g610a
MAIFSIKPLIHLSREVVKKWDGSGSLVVLFYAVTGSITRILPLPEQPPLLPEQPLPLPEQSLPLPEQPLPLPLPLPEQPLPLVLLEQPLVPLPLPEQPLPLVLLEQPLVPLLTEDMCFSAGPHKSSAAI